MLKLMKLEMKKFKFGGFIKGAIIATLVITALILFIPFAEKLDGNIAFPDYNTAFSVIDSLVGATFIIFSSVIISKLIIEEYRSKTIMLMFMYPINRKKLMISKLLLIGGFIALATAIASVFLTSSLCIYNSFTNVINDQLTATMITERLFKIGVNSITTAGVGLIPLYFGMRKKSVPTTIVSSVILTTILNSNNNGFTLWSVLMIPVIFTVIGILVAYISIRNIEHIDAI